MTTEAGAHFKLYLVREFFDAQSCDELLGELRLCDERPATVYGAGESGAVDERVRRVARLAPSAETVERVKLRLLELMEEIGAHYRLLLGGCEEPQFLRYRVGDFFVAHQDGNTGMLLSERERSRKVSVIIFINGQSESVGPDTYDGGSLVFSDWGAGREFMRFELHADAGALVAFPAETTHEVLPVTRGERYSIVSWYTRGCDDQ
jgi:SM-20-related protein